MEQTIRKNEVVLIKKVITFVEFLADLRNKCSKEHFLIDKKLQHAVIFSLKLIGETLAQRNIPSSLSLCPQLAMRVDDLYKLRDVLTHQFILASPGTELNNFLGEVWERIFHKNDEIKTLFLQLKGLLNERDGNLNATYKNARYFKQFENKIASNLTKKEWGFATFLTLFKDEIKFVLSFSDKINSENIEKDQAAYYALYNSLEIIGTIIKKLPEEIFINLTNSVTERSVRIYLKNFRRQRNAIMHDLEVIPATIMQFIQNMSAIDAALDTYTNASKNEQQQLSQSFQSLVITQPVESQQTTPVIALDVKKSMRLSATAKEFVPRASQLQQTSITHQQTAPSNLNAFFQPPSADTTANVLHPLPYQNPPHLDGKNEKETTFSPQFGNKNEDT